MGGEDAGAPKAADVKSFAQRFRKLGRERRRQEKLREHEDPLDESVPEAGPEPSGDVSAAGLVVGHAADAILPGTEVIMTLKDGEKMFDKEGNVLDTDDVLESTEITAGEKRAFNKQRAKGFDRFDEDQQTTVLAQYDEERQEFEKSRKTFRLDGQGGLEAADTSAAELKKMDNLADGKTRYTFGEDEEKQFAWSKIQSDTYTTEEMASFKKPKRKVVRRKKQFAWSKIQSDTYTTEEMASFKKPKRKVVRRKKPKVEDIEKALRDMPAPEEEVGRRVVDDDELEALERLQVAEASAANLQQERQQRAMQVEALADEPQESTAVAAAPTVSGAETVDAPEPATVSSLTTFMHNVRRSANEHLEEAQAGAPDERCEAAADIDEDRKKKLQGVLQDETDLSTVAGTLAFLKKQHLQKETYAGRATDTIIENDDDDELIRRVDKYGRRMTMEQAYRELSHQYHGKDPSKRSQAKYEKRIAEQQRQLASLGADPAMRHANALRRAQEDSGSAAISIGADVRKTVMSVGDKRRAEQSVDPRLEESIAAKKHRHQG
eukprot:TRINITY_DN30641_c0_g1_i1.p1 TRINITY_DN30641_c0_g1~~TRINITY_DN30641_c0_g1_i1.p1  ORF type:complete len:562 (+),score=238.27 TRINITY_DN30641_c0_g1_i1:38-1687(+)